LLRKTQRGDKPMQEPLKLLCVYAHPDDETLGPGGVLAKYAAEGIETYLITATRGEHGWPGPKEEYPGMTELGQIREKELRAAADVLGIHELILLDYIDGDLDRADPPEIIGQIASQIRRIRPQVVLTFDPQGVYGHPDHIAISQFTLAALVKAAGTDTIGADQNAPHQVSKLYFHAENKALLEAYQALLGEIRMPVDGEERGAEGWIDWAITTEVDIADYWQTFIRAVACHRTQQLQPEKFVTFAEQYDRSIWGRRTYYRAYSMVNGGRKKETDLFAGLR
jgi:LmbE family N-acetylglucosaminyl deacetylase